MVVIVLTSGVAIALSAALIIGYQVVTSRLAAVYDLRSIADVVALHAAEDLQLHDQAAANQTLATLETPANILAARVFDKDGNLFAQYLRPGAKVMWPGAEPVGEEYRMEGARLALAHEIRAGGERIGSVVLHSDRSEEQIRLRYSILIVATLMAAAVCVALLMAARLQEVVSRPIRDLAVVAREVATEKNYSLRAAQTSRDETGLLVAAFNQMLDQIQKRDEDLRVQAEVARNLEEGILLTRASDAVIVYANPKFERMFGYKPRELNGQPVKVINAGADRQPQDAADEIVTALERDGIWSGEIHNRRKDGREFWCYVNISTFDHPVFGNVWIAVHSDITERKELEKKILEVSDREQRRIGQDLHDGLCQLLTGTTFAIKALEQKLAAAGNVESAEAREIAELLRRANVEARNVARGLHPVELEAGGLTAALHELAFNVQSLFNVACRFQCAPAVALVDNDKAVHIYRIAQEAVNNALKHSGAKHIGITLSQSNGTMALTVNDDGIGLPAQAVQHKGMGLNIMAYRARMIGGTLHVRRGGEHGTIVNLVFPN
jgi:PAS domain S-box-containing protein